VILKELKSFDADFSVEFGNLRVEVGDLLFVFESLCVEVCILFALQRFR